MSKKRDLKPKDKKLLINQAGNKCANPGCTNYRTHIHHIKEWAVYETNNIDEMIAVCPSCHDAIHYGRLEINDNTLLNWKKIIRDNLNSDSLFIEPGKEFKLFLGSLTIQGNQVGVFEFSKTKNLSFNVIENDIMFLNLKMEDLYGNEVLKIINNQVRYKNDESIIYEKVPGKIKVLTKNVNNFIEDWSLEKLRVQIPSYGKEKLFELLYIEILKPGLVTVRGIWMKKDYGIVISEKGISFIRKDLFQPITLCGEGENTILNWQGPINENLFEFK